MYHTMYTDDYDIIDITYLVHACKVDPCEEHPDDHSWLIAGVLHVANQAVPLQMAYPTRGHRDQAFESLVALVKREQARAVFDDEEDES